MKDKNICDKSMSFAECELAILRMQVDQAQEKMNKRVVNTPEIKKMITIVEGFIKKKQLVCYGGISINALLPDEDKIYNFDLELPDYDFFSPNALDDAKELTDLFYKMGYADVEAKSGQHHGTFKVYVNFIGVADITYIPKELFNTVKASAVKVNGILYTDANFLRMGMYLELSRPSGDTDRWEKVLKRLTLINKYYPLKDENCDKVKFQREMEDKEKADRIYDTVREVFVDQGVVFFGGYAISQYSQYMPKPLRKKVEHIPDFDVLAHDPKATAEVVKKKLKEIGMNNVTILKHDAIGDIIPLHYELRVGDDTIAFLYKPVACHSYNVLMLNGKKVRIATIDTMLSFYLAFMYANRGYYDKDRILCMSKFLFDVQQKNRLEQKGLLKRFSILCYGHQDSREEMRAEKASKFKELKDKKGTTEYEEWFLNYTPKTSPTSVQPKSARKHNSQKKTKQNKTKSKTLKIRNKSKNTIKIKNVNK
uniref:Poly(A) polymerase catalytic subunit domain-containing protein n=1 Tax=viral metagenome TaxID=1070528 RepID=A0A6C0E316_9ZZZZ